MGISINMSDIKKNKKTIVNRFDLPPEEKKENCYVEGYYGIGDNFYMRPFIKELADNYKIVYLKTAIPDIYYDIENVKFVYPDELKLRTQSEHAKKIPSYVWTKKLHINHC